MRQRKQIIVGWVTENFIPSARADDYGVQKMMESLNNVLTFHKEKSTVQSNAPIHVKRIPIRAMFFLHNFIHLSFDNIMHRNVRVTCQGLIKTISFI